MDSELWRKAEALFVRCADMAPTELAAFLDAECADDPELREAVDGLLRGDTQDDQVQDAIGRTADSLAAAQTDRRIGTQVGAYTITSRIAEGGMGVVYRASRSDKQFEQEVAIKLLTGALATDQLRARFLAERQILANLNHINIAKLLDGGETDDGVPYLVMEYIDGVPLDEFCAVNRLTLDERIALFIQICSAVQYAHGNLIVHRDIKPSNILVTDDGVPRLLDFGIAKILDARDLPAGAALTMDGSRLLTPRHASPEQIRGDQITTASDVYSLGLLLYELLCGSFPYSIDNTTRPSEIENTIVSEDPPAPSARLKAASDTASICRERRTSPARLRQMLSADLDTIVLTALRKEPEARYGSAKELSDDLIRAAENRPIVARPPTFTYLASRYWKRHRTAAIGLIATVSAALIGAIVSTVGFFQAREAERVAIAEAQNAAATADFLVGLFRAADPNESAGDELSVNEVLALGVERIETEMEDTPVVKASILETLSSVYRARGDFENSTLLLERGLELHEQHSHDDPIGRARMTNDLGDLYRILERYDDATAHMERAYDMYEAMGDVSSFDRADVVNNLALLYHQTGRMDDAEGMFFEALGIRSDLYDPPHPDIALSHHNLAWHFARSGKLAEAEQYAHQAVDMRMEHFGEVHPRVAASMSILGDIYFRQARWRDAERTALQSLDMSEQVYEPGNRELSFRMYEVARARHAYGDLQGADDLYARAIDLDRLNYAPDHPNIAHMLRAHAINLTEIGRHDQAEAALREARAIFQQLGESGVTNRERTDTRLADCLLRAGRLDEAAALLGADNADPVALSITDRALRERQLMMASVVLEQGDAARAAQLTDSVLRELADIPGHNLPMLPQALHLHGRAQFALEDSGVALESLGRALALYEESWDEDYWRTALVRTDLGIVYAHNGDTSQGRAELTLAVASLEDSLGSDHSDTRRAVTALAALDSSN